MNDVTFKELSTLYTENIEKYVVKAGGLFPHVTILGSHKDENEDPKNAVIKIPVPPEFMESDEDKYRFVNDVLPEVFRKVKEKFYVDAVGWASEGWMRSVGSDFDIENEDYKILPKKEVLFITLETDDKVETKIYNIKRTGKSINDEGEIIDNISLEINNVLENETKVAGTFSGLYKRLKSS